jgi:hypothetical protein
MTRLLMLLGGVVGAMLAIPFLVVAWTGALTWNANTEADLAGYDVLWVDGPCPANNIYPNSTRLGTVTQYTDTISESVTQRSWAIKAYDTSNNVSAPSLCVTKINTVTPGVPPPPAPTGVTFNPATLTFSWVAVPVSKVRIWIHEGALPYECANGMQCVELPGTASSYVATMQYSTTYDCWMRFVNADGVEGPVSGVACSTGAPPTPLPDTTPPAAPTQLQVAGRPTSGNVLLAWTPTGGTHDAARVDRLNQTTGSWVTLTTTPGPVTQAVAPLAASGRRVYRACALKGTAAFCNEKDGVWASR